MNEYVLKAGNGFLWGVSTTIDQPDKTLTLLDGESIIGSIKLDTAFPARLVVDEYGEKGMMPGILLAITFATNLRVKTDGQGIDFDWR
jgi:hypothetical protein